MLQEDNQYRGYQILKASDVNKSSNALKSDFENIVQIMWLS